MNCCIHLTNDIIFREKPNAVPYNYRISYKISQICIMIHYCSKRGCSLNKLHMLSTGLSSAEDGKDLRNFITYGISPYNLIRYDPAINRALKYAIMDNLVMQQNSGSYILTPLGKIYVEKIYNDYTLLQIEKKFLIEVGNKLTEKKIKALTSFWRYIDVTD